MNTGCFDKDEFTLQKNNLQAIKLCIYTEEDLIQQKEVQCITSRIKQRIAWDKNNKPEQMMFKSFASL